MRILFMGTPDFAVPSLDALLRAGHEICGVFTQPDRPKNRGMKLSVTPVKEFSISHDLAAFQPLTLKDGTAMEQIRTLAPELIVVAAYGRILPKEMLEYPTFGCINVHASLLPKYRGAAPINWAILRGETETGVTIMHMAPELDAGDMIDQVRTEIIPDETAQQLYGRLAALGGKLLVKTVAQIQAGTAGRTPQDHEKATYAPMLSRSLSPIDWNRSARQICDQIRGLLPWPAAATDIFNGHTVKIFSAAAAAGHTEAAAGTILTADKNGIDVACGNGSILRVLELQAEGKRRMTAADYLRGNPIQCR